MKRYKLILTATILCVAFQVKSQTNPSVSLTNIENDFQKCQEENENMLSCSQGHYQQLDAILKTVLKEVGSQLEVSKRTAFRAEQTAWNQKKEAYFRELPKSVKADNEDMSGPDLQAAVFDKKSEFLMERINELMGMGDGGE